MKVSKPLSGQRAQYLHFSFVKYPKCYSSLGDQTHNLPSPTEVHCSADWAKPVVVNTHFHAPLRPWGLNQQHPALQSSTVLTEQNLLQLTCTFYLKTLSVGVIVGIEPITSCSAVHRSTDWAKTAVVNAHLGSNPQPPPPALQVRVLLTDLNLPWLTHTSFFFFKIVYNVRTVH